MHNCHSEQREESNVPCHLSKERSVGYRLRMTLSHVRAKNLMVIVSSFVLVMLLANLLLPHDSRAESQALV